MRPTALRLLQQTHRLRAGGGHAPAHGERPYGYVHEPWPARWQVVWGKAIGVFMWTFIFWRAYEDRGVAFGFQLPHEAHPPHDHHHGHDEHGNDLGHSAQTHPINASRAAP